MVRTTMISRGVELLRLGKYLEATHFFRKALDLLLDDACSREEQNIDDSASPPVKMTVRSVDLHDLDQQHDLPSSFQNIPEEHNPFVAFEKAFLPVTDNDCKISSHLNQDILSTILFFNLGLCFHLAAVHGGINQQSNLRKALQLYTTAGEILSSENLCIQEPLLSLAVTNNLGSIYSHFFLCSNATDCLGWIRRFLESTCPHECGGMCNLAIFRLNILSWKGSRSFAAAA